MKFLRNKVFAGICGGLIVTILSLGLIFWNPLEKIHLYISSFLYTRNEPSPFITIIAIDDKSLDFLGNFKDWPRTYYVKLLEIFKKYNPAVIGFDIDFSEPSEGLSNARILELTKAVERGQKVDFYLILKGIAALDDHPDDKLFQETLSSFLKIVLYSFQKEPIFSGKNIKNGEANFILEADNKIHKTTLDNKFAFQVFKLFSNKEFPENFPVDTEKEFLINFATKPGVYNTISFIDVLQEKFDPNLIASKIVLIGAVSPILHDFKMTPISKISMPGVEIHANILQQLLEGKYLRDQTKLEEILMIGGLTLLGSIAMNSLPMLFALFVFIAYLIFYSIAAKIVFDRGVLLNMIYPYLAFLAMYIIAILYKYFTEVREKMLVKSAFSHYVNPQVVSSILKSPETLKLGGEKRKVSVLFSDIVGFTGIAEKMRPEELILVLNEYLDAMSSVILKNNGTLDKFEGDAIMAFFGAPVATPDFEKIACQSAVEMRFYLQKLHEKWHLENRPLFDFCVGIASGEVIVGNMGGRERFDYTVIGDTVNLCARLESANRLYGTKILIDEPTFLKCKNDFVFRKIDRIRVKGKKVPVTVYELLGLPNIVASEAKQSLADFETGLIYYEKRRFEEAEKYFESCLKISPNDGPSLIYKNRCGYLMKNPPPADWDFVVDLMEK